MKKKSLFLSAMLTCVISLFTSCVQGDLYEMYDEDGLLIPRSKKSKDLPPMCGVDKSFLYSETFHNNECVACVYKNLTNCSSSQARRKIIEAMYGEYNDANFIKYRDLVYNPNNANNPIVDLSYLCQALGGHWGGVLPQAFASNYINNPNLSCFSNIAIITDGGNHIAYVNDKSYSGSGILTFTFSVSDPYTNTPRAKDSYSFSVNAMNNYSFESGDVTYVFMNVPEPPKPRH